MINVNRTPASEQEVDLRIKNFDEVCLGYNEEQAITEANRCLQCKVPRCVGKCPVNNHIPQFIKAIREKDFEGAAKILAETTALPAVCGRVCPQEIQCEGGCVLGIKGEPVSIGNLERFAADWCREHNIDLNKDVKKESNGIKVAVVGSGPAGITCAEDLAKLGYEVTIFEALHEPGGVLTWGIPEFVLPKERVVKSEIDNVKKLGVKIETNVYIGKTITIDELIEKEKFAAVFVATGAAVPNFMGIPGENLNGVLAANEFLTKNNLMKDYKEDYKTPLVVGKKVAVVGGGNVAMDAVRAALRLGAEAHLIYRRSEAELPSRVEEVKYAKKEGVHFHLLTNPVEILDDAEGWVNGIKCVKMQLGEPDASGRRRPVTVEGSEFVLDVDMVIMAIGSGSNALLKETTEGLEVDRKNLIIADESTCKTSKPRVYAGGDAVTGPATVILAMAAGKKAAKAIHEELSK